MLNIQFRPTRAGERRAVALASALVLLAVPALAPACGLEDPSSILMRRGALNQAYPESLRVGTAVWQAQLAGTLPRDALARRADLPPEARARRRLAHAEEQLGRLAARLNARPAAAASAERRDLAIVLVGPVLWSRLQVGTGRVRTQTHVDGPEPGDVVAVTDTAVVEAIAQGRMDFARAREAGLLRLYGEPADVAAAYDWLAAAGRQ